MITLEGHSSFKVEIKKEKEQHYVIEKSSILQEKDRLEKQLEKQKMFYEENIFENVRIPKILFYKTTETRFIGAMEFIKNSDNVIDFLNRNNISTISSFPSKLIQIIETMIEKCSPGKIKSSILSEKIKSIQENISTNQLTRSFNLTPVFEMLNNKIKTICKVALPIGLCHGDLTLSNILIGYNDFNIYLIDFLDSFIETPLFDILKIRQDTFHLWSLKLFKNKCDKNKIIIHLNYIDEIIHTHFKKYHWYEEVSDYYQIINLLRVFQYCKTESTASFLYKQINELFILYKQNDELFISQPKYMKVAIGFFGITRSLSYTIESIRKNIFDVFEYNNIEYDVYIHYYNLGKFYFNKRADERLSDTSTHKKEYKLLKPKYIKSDNQEKIIQRDKLKLKEYRKIKDPWNTNYQTVNNYILGSYSKYLLTKMIEENIDQYDYVMFMRPDCLYHDKLDLKFFDLVNDKSVVIPDTFCWGPYSINDRFAITNKATYRIYGKIFEKLKEYSRKKPGLHSETVLGKILVHENKLDINRVKFDFSRIRINGRVEDKFDGKFEEDFVEKVTD